MREKLQNIYSKYSIYIQKALQFLAGLIVFGMINANIGFMEQASSVICTAGLAVICTFFPMMIMTLAATALIPCTVLCGVHAYRGRIACHLLF